MSSNNDLVTFSSGSSPGTDELNAKLARRDAEISRLESTLAEERHAALAIRAEFDRLKKAHDALDAERKQSTLAARWRRFFGG